MGMKTATTCKPMKRTMKKKTSVIARGKRAKSSVFRGTKAKTAGGLTRDGLMRNKHGRIVSKKASAAAKKKGGDRWLRCLDQGGWPGPQGAWLERLRGDRREIRGRQGALCQSESHPGRLEVKRRTRAYHSG